MRYGDICALLDVAQNASWGGFVESVRAGALLPHSKVGVSPRRLVRHSLGLGLLRGGVNAGGCEFEADEPGAGNAVARDFGAGELPLAGGLFG